MEAGLQLIEEQRLPEALAFFQSLTMQDGNNAEAYNYLGMVHALLGDTNSAIESIEKAVAINPNYAEGLTNLGVLLAMTDRKEEAIGYYRQALAVNPNLPEVHNNLGVLLREKGEIEAAIKSFEQALTLFPDYIDALNGLALCLSNSGKLDEAVAQLRRALTLEPDRFETNLNLGLVLREKKELEEATIIFQKAIGLDPVRAEAYNHLGLVYRDQKRLVEAELQFRKAISLDAEYAEAYRNLGVVLYRQGTTESNPKKKEEAIGLFERCLELDPNMPEAYNNLGITYKDKGDFAKAKDYFLKALELRPTYALPCKNLGEIFVNEKDYASAIRYYYQSIDYNPKDVDSFVLLANILVKEKRLEESLAVCRKGIELNPEAIELYKSQASMFMQGNNPDEALKILMKAKELEPDNISVTELLGAALLGAGRLAEARSEWESILSKQSNFNLEIKLALSLPIILESTGQIKIERQRLVNSLHHLLEKKVSFDNPLTNVSTCNFYLAYHGENDRAILEEIGRFFCQACPNLVWTAPHCLNPQTIIRDRIRIGICSKFLRSHTIGRLYGTIVEYLDRSKFEVILIRVPDKNLDEKAKALAECADRLVELEYDFFKDRETIGNLELDILFYPDIGMEPLTYFFTFSRLAPVQCLTWGHPSTTGSPMMDYFISSKYFETSSAKDHFTEKLIRFREPNICYNRPETPPQTDRAALGLPTECTLYICPQSLFKIHPEFDPIVAGILQGDIAGKVVFLNSLSSAWRERILERWQKTLPDFIDRIVFINGLPHKQYLQLLQSGDVMLDPIHFGGGNTSLEAFAMGTPVVTYPGEYTKSRLTLGFYHKMEITDCIANSPEEYIQIALKLGKDRQYNQQIREKINERSSCLFNNREVIREYEKFFVTALTLYRAGR